MSKVAPEPEAMARDSVKVLTSYPSMFVKQTRKGCMQELMGCEATNEFKMFPTKEDAKAKSEESFYSLEESDCCMRFLCANGRAFTQTIWNGTKENRGDVVMKMSKECSLAAQPCCCCCMPLITFTDGAGAKIGTSDVPTFFCFLPQIKVRDSSGTEEYMVQMPSCCGGMCVDCMAEGCCNCKVPFYIFPPGKPGTRGNEVGKIVKLWRGMGTEAFSDAASFNVEFPEGSGEMSKARLLGTTIFINMLFFEKQQ